MTSVARKSAGTKTFFITEGSYFLEQKDMNEYRNADAATEGCHVKKRL